jgi:hypothetical protein
MTAAPFPLFEQFPLFERFPLFKPHKKAATGCPVAACDHL